MAGTPVGTATPYCTAERVVKLIDWQILADLLRDGSAPRPQRAAVLASPLLASFLLRASGEVEAAVLAGNRYRPADLAALTDSGAAYLEGLVATLTHWRLAQRRQPGAADPDTVPGAREALDTLAAWRDGQMVFGLQETHDAGLPAAVPASDPKRQVSVFQRAYRLFGNHGY